MFQVGPLPCTSRPPPVRLPCTSRAPPVHLLCTSSQNVPSTGENSFCGCFLCCSGARFPTQKRRSQSPPPAGPGGVPARVSPHKNADPRVFLQRLPVPPWTPPWVPWASLGFPGLSDPHSGTPSFLNKFGTQTDILWPAVQGGPLPSTSRPPPGAPPWAGFPLTTVASRRLPGHLPG